MEMLRVIGTPELIFLPYTSVVCITELTSVLEAERKQKGTVLSTFMDHMKGVRSEQQSGCEYVRTQEHPVPIVNGALHLKSTLFYFCFLFFPFCNIQRKLNANWYLFYRGPDTSPPLIRKWEVSVALATESWWQQTWGQEEGLWLFTSLFWGRRWNPHPLH